MACCLRYHYRLDHRFKALDDVEAALRLNPLCSPCYQLHYVIHMALGENALAHQDLKTLYMVNAEADHPQILRLLGALGRLPSSAKLRRVRRELQDLLRCPRAAGQDLSSAGPEVVQDEELTFVWT